MIRSSGQYLFISVSPIKKISLNTSHTHTHTYIRNSKLHISYNEKMKMSLGPPKKKVHADKFKVLTRVLYLCNS